MKLLLKLTMVICLSSFSLSASDQLTLVNYAGGDHSGINDAGFNDSGLLNLACELKALTSSSELISIERDLYIILAYTRQLELTITPIINFLASIKGKYAQYIDFNMSGNSQQYVLYVRSIIGLVVYFYSVGGLGAGGLDLTSVNQVNIFLDQINNIYLSTQNIALTLPFLQFAISLINDLAPNSVLPANPTLNQKLVYISLVFGLISDYASWQQF